MSYSFPAIVYLASHKSSMLCLFGKKNPFRNQSADYFKGLLQRLISTFLYLWTVGRREGAGWSEIRSRCTTVAGIFPEL